jgi:hypothetical protein
MQEHAEDDGARGAASEGQKAVNGLQQTPIPVRDLLTCLLSTLPSFSLASHLAEGVQRLQIEVPDGVRLTISQLDAASHIQSLTVLEALVEKVAAAASNWESGQNQDVVAAFCKVGTNVCWLAMSSVLVQQFPIGMWAIRQHMMMCRFKTGVPSRSSRSPASCVQVGCTLSLG